MQHQEDGLLLQGVPKIGFDTDLFCTFVGSLKSIFESLGDPIDYDYIMGASGLAFRRFFNRDDGGNVDPMRLAPDSLCRTFWVLGYDYRVISDAEGRAPMLEAMKESVGKGIPVLATGIIGPPESGILAGYSQGGDVVHGWSYFQEPPADAYYAQPDWFEKAEWWHSVGMVLLGDKKPGPLPTRREVFEATLPWVIQIERETEHPGAPDHVAGLAAYDAWADDLDAGTDYDSDDPDVMQIRHWVGMDEATMVHERRNASAFLRLVADAAPEATDLLLAAADLYGDVGHESGAVYPWRENWTPPDLADPSVRAGIAQHVRLCRDLETRAVEVLEQAQARLGG